MVLSDTRLYDFVRVWGKTRWKTQGSRINQMKGQPMEMRVLTSGMKTEIKLKRNSHNKVVQLWP